MGSAKETLLEFQAGSELSDGPLLSRPHKSILLTFLAMAHYSCRVTVFEARVMQRCGWTSAKSDDFSVFSAQPIKRHTRLLHRNTARRRERTKRISATGRPFSCPLSRFKSHHLGQQRQGRANQPLLCCCLLQPRPASRGMKKVRLSSSADVEN